jgi:hypothetical protein
MNRVYVLMFLLVLFSCQKTEEVILYPAFTPKLANITFISAGDVLIVASFQYTRPSFQDTSQNIDFVAAKNVVAELLTNGAINPIEFDSFSDQYQTVLSTPAFPGQSFTLNATDGNQRITGSTTIPFPAKIDLSFRLDSNIVPEIGLRYSAKLTFTHKGNQPQYVRIIPRMYFSTGGSEIMNDESYTHIAKLLPGQSFTQEFRIFKPTTEDFPDSIECTVLSCDEAYAKYYNAAVSSIFDLFPNTEPTIQYSNMSNKIGVIASYTLSESKILNIK